MKKRIIIYYYPATFSFITDVELPEFDEEEGYCEVRTQLVHQAMKEQNIYSPCHLWEDYVVETVEKISDGELWQLGS